MSETLFKMVSLERFECIKCGVAFAVPASLADSMRKDGGMFYCPNGHQQGWLETEADRLRKKLVEANCEALRQKQARIAAEEAYFREQKAKDRLAKRVRNGVCPCCNRTFSNLARHMKTKHPETK